MAEDQNAAPSGGAARDVRVRIFTYPKIIFIYPTIIVAFICGLGMTLIRDNTRDPTGPYGVLAKGPAFTGIEKQGPDTAESAPTKVRRFSTTQNILGVVFLLVLFFNLMVMAIDFPRFTVFAVLLLVMALSFFILWLNAYYDLLPPVVNFLEGIYAVANAQFYYLVGILGLIVFGVIWITRYLDYWEIMPNEILHNHGPFSDLERYPTFNLKFDKEIPDILEYFMAGSGRLVLHVAGHNRAIVLENVPFINAKENELKKLMSRFEVRVSPDKEVV